MGRGLNSTRRSGLTSTFYCLSQAGGLAMAGVFLPPAQVPQAPASLLSPLPNQRPSTHPSALCLPAVLLLACNSLTTGGLVPQVYLLRGSPCGHTACTDLRALPKAPVQLRVVVLIEEKKRTMMGGSTLRGLILGSLL